MPHSRLRVSEAQPAQAEGAQRQAPGSDSRQGTGRARCRSGRCLVDSEAAACGGDEVEGEGTGWGWPAEICRNKQKYARNMLQYAKLSVLICRICSLRNQYITTYSTYDCAIAICIIRIIWTLHRSGSRRDSAGAGPPGPGRLVPAAWPGSGRCARYYCIPAGNLNDFCQSPAQARGPLDSDLTVRQTRMSGRLPRRHGGTARTGVTVRDSAGGGGHARTVGPRSS
jgi:hypothetical protein